MDDNTRQVVRDEETVVAGEPRQNVVQQTETSTANATNAAVPPTPAVANQSTVQTTTASTAPRDRAVSHNVAERVVDPAAEKLAAVAWVDRLIWFIVGVI